MNIAFYSGVSGMVAYQQEMDVLAHNIANVNTTGFKPSVVSFDDLLYTQMDINNNEQEFLTGHGVKAAATNLLYRQGATTATNNNLDFALIGEGFFAVEREGAVEYTRNGAFDISVQGNRGYLVTSDGGYVLDARGRRIRLEKSGNSDTYDLEELPEQIGVYTFPNPYGLLPANGSSFLETAVSGEAQAVNTGRQRDELPYRLVSQALESSAVDLSDEMVNMIMTQKAFQFNAKVVQTADEIEEIVNNLR